MQYFNAKWYNSLTRHRIKKKKIIKSTDFDILEFFNLSCKIKDFINQRFMKFMSCNFNDNNYFYFFV